MKFEPNISIYNLKNATINSLIVSKWNILAKSCIMAVNRQGEAYKDGELHLIDEPHLNETDFNG